MCICYSLLLYLKETDKMNFSSFGFSIFLMINLFKLLIAAEENHEVVYMTQDNHHMNPSIEFRGVWIATVANIDWPPAGVYDSVIQEEDLVEYLDVFSNVNINAIFFHVRPRGDAFYNSSIEPWSIYLKGTQGVPPDPYYDPLQFLIDEASQRGIEVHAWLNPYIANKPATFEGLAPNHVAMRYPQYAYAYGTFLWMDPGAQQVIDNLQNVITDIITRYQVNGIHFDDFFYPYPEDGEYFADNATYTLYLDQGGTMSLEDWRRDNINRMIQSVYQTIKSHNSNIKFTVSPFGLYRPGHPDGMPDTIKGLDPYSAMFADSKLWLQSGWVDALIPQLYWRIDPPEQSYPVCLDWWLSVNNASRHIYAGNGAYRLPTEEGNWPVSELINQTGISRLPENRARSSLGNVWFSAKYFKSNTKNITTTFGGSIYSTPAEVPEML